MKLILKFKILNRVFKKVLIRVLNFYILKISPNLPSRCRFYPTCSQYCVEAILHFGIVKGLIYGILRLLKCGLWLGCGFDPVLKKVKK